MFHRRIYPVRRHERRENEEQDRLTALVAKNRKQSAEMRQSFFIFDASSNSVREPAFDHRESREC